MITAKAKSAIKASLKSETKNRIDKGKKILEEKLKELNLIPSSRIFKKLLPIYSLTSKDELYSKIGSGIITLDDLKKILKKNTKSKWIKYWELSFGKPNKEKENVNFDPDETFLVTENIDEDETGYILASCCNPIPGDEVIGYRDFDGTVIIHQVR